MRYVYFYWPRVGMRITRTRLFYIQSQQQHRMDAITVDSLPTLTSLLRGYSVVCAARKSFESLEELRTRRTRTRKSNSISTQNFIDTFPKSLLLDLASSGRTLQFIYLCSSRGPGCCCSWKR